MTIRPNYYRAKVRARKLTNTKETRASHEVEIECQDLIEALALDFNAGNALKYLFRAGRKTPSTFDDLKKAQTYIGFALDALAGKS